MIKLFITATVASFLGSGLFVNFVQPYISFNEFKVGECFSNGLYLEKIVDKEYGQYIMLGYIRGKWLIPDKTSESVLMRLHTKIECPASMQETPYKRATND